MFLCERLVQRAISLGVDRGLLIGIVGRSNFGISEIRSLKTRGINSFEFAAPITEPHHNIARVERISPDQIGRTVSVDVLSEQRSNIPTDGIEVQKRSLSASAQQDPDALVEARAIYPGLI